MTGPTQFYQFSPLNFAHCLIADDSLKIYVVGVPTRSLSHCIRHIPLSGFPVSRSRLAIIPQDPFLFSGTVRENLDPTHTYPDPDLWTALDKCHLRTAVERLGGLDADMAERGRHFSVGQRQLLCLARAMITRAKVKSWGCLDVVVVIVILLLVQQ